MEEFNNSKPRQHKLTVLNRTVCNLTGVLDVLSFDVSEILLETDQGMLMIRGKELHVTRLTLEKGEIDIDGRIDSITYSETSATQGKSESLLGKLFR